MSGLPRPDIPVLRHLSFDEAHAALLGLVGALVALTFLYGGLVLDLVGAVVALAVTATILFDLPRESEAARLLGRETWYFVVVFVGSALGTAEVVA